MGGWRGQGLVNTPFHTHTHTHTHTGEVKDRGVNEKVNAARGVSTKRKTMDWARVQGGEGGRGEEGEGEGCERATCYHSSGGDGGSGEAIPPIMCYLIHTK